MLLEVRHTNSSPDIVNNKRSPVNRRGLLSCPLGDEIGGELGLGRFKQSNALVVNIGALRPGGLEELCALCDFSGTDGSQGVGWRRGCRDGTGLDLGGDNGSLAWCRAGSSIVGGHVEGK